MKNNATILGSLEQLINVLDCKSYIFIYSGTDENYTNIFQGNVYEFLAKSDFYTDYMDCQVTCLTFGGLTGTSILISEV